MIGKLPDKLLEQMRMSARHRLRASGIIFGPLFEHCFVGPIVALSPESPRWPKSIGSMDTAIEERMAKAKLNHRV
jgi:hypothetical protein